ncbi:MAG: GNAT family N-acetyltransferase [Flavobacteriaceae bacterium]|nr:GNAT family N-acetyltransferase [Flavobacteriaceae bacterium]
MDLSEYTFLKLNQQTKIKSFDCGDDTLNDFLFNKSKPYSSELLSTTFIIEDEYQTVAYFSIFNDSLKVEEEEFASKNSLKRFLKNLVSHPKRHLEYFPAIKIGRLAVNKNIKKSGLGKTIINYIIDYALEQNEKCACKLLTVDAYKNSLAFYEKMGFEYLSPNDKVDSTRQMYLNLNNFITR